MPKDDCPLFRAIEALKGAYAEIDAMMETYDDYVPSGRLCDQIERSISELEKLYEAQR